jgi:hypothetical protein
MGKKCDFHPSFEAACLCPYGVQIGARVHPDTRTSGIEVKSVRWHYGLRSFWLVTTG